MRLPPVFQAGLPPGAAAVHLQPVQSGPLLLDARQTPAPRLPPMLGTDTSWAVEVQHRQQPQFLAISVKFKIVVYSFAVYQAKVGIF